jgi:hypothetical protein
MMPHDTTHAIIMQHKMPLLLYMTHLFQDMIGNGADSVDVE